MFVCLFLTTHGNQLVPHSWREKINTTEGIWNQYCGHHNNSSSNDIETYYYQKSGSFYFIIFKQMNVERLALSDAIEINETYIFLSTSILVVFSSNAIFIFETLMNHFKKGNFQDLK